MSIPESIQWGGDPEVSPRVGFFGIVTDRLNDALIQGSRHPSWRYTTSGRDENLKPVVFLALFAKVGNKPTHMEIGIPVVEPDPTHPVISNTADYLLERVYEEGRPSIRQIPVVEGEPLSKEAQQLSEFLQSAVVVPLRPSEFK